MRKIVILMFLCTLSGCVSTQQAQLNASAQRAQQEIEAKCPFYMSVSPKEAQAWIAAGEQSQQCTVGIQEPWPKDKMMEISKCSTVIMNQKIKPVAYSAEAYQRYMNDRIASQKAYIAGEIGWDDLTRKTGERMQEYFGKEQHGGTYLAFTNCGNEILSREVFPTYQYKPLLTEYMANIAAFSRKADKEKMEPEDFGIGAQQIWSDFANKEQQIMAQQQAQNAAASRDFSRQLQQFSQQLNQQNAISAQQCTSISIAPIASPGCKNVCINGRWSEVC